MKTAIVTIPGVPIDPATGLKREPSREPRHREAGFDSKFDSETLFYEAVWSPERDAVRIIAPPLFNLKPSLAQSRFTDGAQSGALGFKVVNYDRQTQIFLRKGGTDSVSLAGPIGNYVIPVVHPEHHLFAGRRAIFTLSKNNDLAWIKEWLEFYHRVHGANAVLIYDNNSSDYDAEDLMSTLSSISGIEVAVVVRWPFKHGPTGQGLKKHWDSNFSQLAMMEHARARFLARAKSVLNCDIDELVVSKGHGSIFEAVERSKSGVIAFYGDWVVGIQGVTREGSPSEPLKFRDFRVTLKDCVDFRLALNPFQRTRCKAKWAVAPERMPAKARWHIHYIENWLASRLPSKHFRFRHFREISRSWKYDRTRRDMFDPARHVEDPIMAEAFRRVGWIDGADKNDAESKFTAPQLSSFSS